MDGFTLKGDQPTPLSSGVVICETQRLPLVPGQYSLSAWLADWLEDYDAKIDALTVQLSGFNGNQLRPPPSIDRLRGLAGHVECCGGRNLSRT